MKILIIEDERGMANGLEYNFKNEGFEVLVAYDGADGLRKAQQNLPDVVVLDLMLPGLPGEAVCKELRANAATRDIPILMLTAKTEENDELIGFAVGADDYVHKPFKVQLLVQRVRALIRRAEGANDPASVVEHLGVRIDRVKHRASVNSEELTLTPTEFKLLECLLGQPGRAFSRHQLMDKAIGQGSIVLERTIDVHVKTLRKKLRNEGLIETVRGVGYRFREGP